MSATAATFPKYQIEDLGFAPVDGWVMCERRGPLRGDQPQRLAWKDGQEILLCTSPWHFTPTQDRFAWIVRNNFPLGYRTHNDRHTTLDDAFIDAAIAAETRGVAA